MHAAKSAAAAGDMYWADGVHCPAPTEAGLMLQLPEPFANTADAGLKLQISEPCTDGPTVPEMPIRY